MTSLQAMWPAVLRPNLRIFYIHVPLRVGPLKLGEVKSFKSIMGGVLMNLVNYGGSSDDIDMTLTFQM